MKKRTTLLAAALALVLATPTSADAAWWELKCSLEAWIITLGSCSLP